MPAAPALPSLVEWVVLLAVALMSFGGQLVLGRAYQIEVAYRVAAVTYIQVGLPVLALNAALRLHVSRLLAHGLLSSRLGKDMAAACAPGRLAGDS